MGDFVHLHLHTEYSLLDGATRISMIADKAISEGQSAVAITDHGVMYGVVEFYNELKKRGIKPIIGCEVYVAKNSRFDRDDRNDGSRNHLVLLCKNSKGYKNLCYLVSEAFINGFYVKPRIDMELLSEYHEGLIALSGCIGGRIPKYILEGSLEEAEQEALRMKKLFGEDFYLEIQNHGMEDERKVAYALRRISEKYDIPLVATNDVHYLEKSDADTQATLMCIQTNNVITDGRPFGFETDEYYFKSTEEMKTLFSSFKGAIENTVKIAEKCNFDFEFDKLHLPDFKADDGRTHKEKLRYDTYFGFENKIKDGRFDFTRHNREEYIDRIEYELSVIDKMGFNAYFLIVSDFVAFAKRSDIPVGPGRGSGAGSLVAFCIGITDVDPIAFDLLFERFLNPERVSMPDFDIDFCYNRREEVIEYVKRKYGEDKVAQIVTFGTMAARAAVRDVGRALGIPYNRVDSVAKLIPSNLPIKTALSISEIKELYNSDQEIRHLLDVSMSLEGMPRHASTHAAGVVITELPTYEYVPLSYSGTGIVTQFDMLTDAKLGLVKFDFLGLRYITVIHDAQALIRKRIPDFDLSKIAFDDPLTFKLLSDAKTDGVFQLESAGMKQVLSNLMPSTLEDVVACIALYRPGPMDSIDKFIERKHGRERVEYKIEALADILDVTYGCIVYQEQVMQICRTLAGYSFAHADIVRRAMSKKDENVMKAEAKSFIDGCKERGIDEKYSREIFDEMVGFAKYAFNKSHATAYGVISYKTAYLKAHFPAEYYSALMTSVLSDASKLREYISDASKQGVSVLAPDINKSGLDFTVVDGNIRYGLLAIKNVGRAFVNAVISEREKRPFKTFDEFVSRMAKSDLNKRTLESFIKCGVFDSLGVSRSSLMRCYESIVDSVLENERNNLDGQMDLLSLMLSSDVGTSSATYTYPDVPEFSLKELLLLERESSGMYFSGHPLDDYTKHINSLGVDNLTEILADIENEGEASKYTSKKNVKLAGVINSVKTKNLKNGDTMAFIQLEDRFAEVEVIVFAKQYSRVSRLISTDNVVLIEGTLSIEDNDQIKVLLSDIKTLISNGDYGEVIKKTEEKKENNVNTLYIKVDKLDDKRIPSLTRIAMLNPGKCRIIVFEASTRRSSLLKDTFINPSEKVISRLASTFGEENVVLK